MGVENALADIKGKPFPGVPIHLRDTSYRGAAKLGHGKGYKYAHDFPGHFVRQQYLPDGFEDRVYYRPTTNGREAKVKELLEKLYPEKDRKEK